VMALRRGRFSKVRGGRNFVPQTDHLSKKALSVRGRGLRIRWYAGVPLCRQKEGENSPERGEKPTPDSHCADKCVELDWGFESREGQGEGPTDPLGPLGRFSAKRNQPGKKPRRGREELVRRNAQYEGA